MAASCTYSVSVDKPDLPEANVAKIPAKVGIYYGAEFNSFEVREHLSVDEDFYLETDIGPASFAVIDATLRSAFNDVHQVSSVHPEELIDGGIEAVFEPKIKDFSYDFSSAGRVEVQITYELYVHALQLQSFSFAVNGEFKNGGWGIIYSRAPKNISAAMRDAASKLLIIFNGLSQESNWHADLRRQAADARHPIGPTGVRP